MEDYINIIINLIFTAFCYTFIPILLKKNVENYSKRKMRNICIINSIGVGIFFIVLRTLLNPEQPISISSATFFYFFINYYLIFGANRKNDNLSPINDTLKTSKKDTVSDNLINSKDPNQIKLENVKSTKVKNKKTNLKLSSKTFIIIAICTLVFLILFLVGYLLYDYISGLKLEASHYKSLYETKIKQYDKLDKKYTDLLTDYLQK